MTLLTEEEAKTKHVCPLFAVAGSMASIIAPKVSHDRITKGVLCAGSACMWWRFGKVHVERRNLPVGEQPEPDAKSKGWGTPTTTTTGKVVWEREGIKRGYCGMAGQP